MTSAERTLKFAVDWRKTLVDKHDGHPERLTREEFGMLVTLNTIIYYIQEMT